MAEVKSFIIRLLTLAAMLYVLVFIVFGIRISPNNEMLPRVRAGDLLFFYRLENNLKSGDAICYKVDGEKYIGRIMAASGDSIDIDDNGNVILNGAILVEDDIKGSTGKYDTNITYPIILGENEYFILADNRTLAKDSRYFGVVNKKSIEGKIIIVIRKDNI
ncbi:signal peptidase I [Lachnoanaerobaculum umeaense]|uniref:Signal peptidase I n=1 Tax=Lachnoanaerobaculum umeaense TaxID=617123 RepID=A0A385PZ50_9FIRM|nr:signal peptidase I [Lachnoanaerobaculum umeaense]